MVPLHQTMPWVMLVHQATSLDGASTPNYALNGASTPDHAPGWCQYTRLRPWVMLVHQPTPLGDAGTQEDYAPG